jgi:hypothetical protein
MMADIPSLMARLYAVTGPAGLRPSGTVGSVSSVPAWTGSHGAVLSPRWMAAAAEFAAANATPTPGQALHAVATYAATSHYFESEVTHEPTEILTI